MEGQQASLRHLFKNSLFCHDYFLRKYGLLFFDDLAKEGDDMSVHLSIKVKDLARRCKIRMLVVIHIIYFSRECIKIKIFLLHQYDK